jgi:hypothetical protein
VLVDQVGGSVDLIGLCQDGWLALVYAARLNTSGTAPGFSLATTTPISQKAATPEPSVLDGYKEYKNQQLGFSVHYPADIPPKEYADQPPGFTVAFQNGDGTAGFQIYAAPIAANEITKERFSRDEPWGVRKDPKDTSVDGSSPRPRLPVERHDFNSASRRASHAATAALISGIQL